MLGPNLTHIYIYNTAAMRRSFALADLVTAPLVAVNARRYLRDIVMIHLVGLVQQMSFG